MSPAPAPAPTIDSDGPAAPPTLSVVVPAWNESDRIGATLDAVAAAAAELGRSVELVVVDDDSDDDTAAVARGRGARVVPVSKRQIGAVRNAGAAVSRAPVLVFVDADTLVDATVLRAALAALDDGAVGGGATVRFDVPVPAWARLCLWLVSAHARVRTRPPGCFLFARRDVFERVGGFDESLYATEEFALARDLRRVGRVVVLRETVVTSARKVDLFGLRGSMAVLARLLLRGPRMLRDRRHLDMWYGDRVR